ncbi:hypothetical protein POPTR_010G163600v4 [Populus trichocarpa]|uniref:Uncharacterized protein n=1 Tax=Populus trichocarpa TaxID=3694 RepID=A0ACC0SDS7_POPTR|nr:hypothetical protein POPTR_010G163600v4 [Populus trichocarpa]
MPHVQGIMMESNIQEKVHEVEEFFDGHLKPQLVRAIAERDKVFEQQKMFSDLRRNIENLEKNSVRWSTLAPYCTCKLMCQIPTAYLWVLDLDSMWSLPGKVCVGIRELLQLPADKSLPERVF